MELSRKRKTGEEDFTVKQLCHKKRGRPLLLGSSLDDAVKEYILQVRENNSIINTAIVVGGL